MGLPGVSPLERLPPSCSLASALDADHLDRNTTDDEGFWRIPATDTFGNADGTVLQPRGITGSRPRPAHTHLTTQDLALLFSEIKLPELASSPAVLSSPLNLYVVHESGVKTSVAAKLHVRSLTSSSDEHTTTMTTTPSAPGSPPELSGSRSSKSSSYSSQFSNADGIASDITNFEDIGLDDDKLAGGQERAQSDTAALRRFEISKESVYPKENLTGEKRATLPNLKSPVTEAIPRQDNTRMGGGERVPTLKRGFTSPAVYGAAHQASVVARPRSSSPPRRMTTSMSTSSLSAGGVRPHQPALGSSLGLPSRRRSWQPQRKSIVELEAEYHDSDDELPDDASLWNVPVSPYPSGQHSSRSSVRGSPEREAAAYSPRPIPLAHAITAPETSPRPALYSQSLLKKSRPPPLRSVSLNMSLSNPSSPRSRNPRRNGRTKSWNVAVAELSEEARIISEALEHHAAMVEREQGENLQNGTARQNLDSLPDGGRHYKAIQLPPVQKGNLDFMPMSKEKEAVLSRTRPSWLPPKDPKEERKHLKQYQRMMAASMQAEKKKRAQMRVKQCEQDDTRDSLSRIWQYYVDESTDVTTPDKCAYDLCWRGVSPKLRGRVWQKAIGNDLGLTTQSYEKALKRAKDIQSQRPQRELNHTETPMERWFVDIERDAETAFPDLNLFQKHGPLWQDLIDVCEAYACYRSDVGYVYGIQLISALLLLQLPTPADAFILLANCLNRPVPLAFQTNDSATTSRTYNHTVSTLGIKFPRLHEYLFGSVEQGGLGFTGEEVFEPMFRTIFSNGLDVDRLSRVWDIWAMEGDRTLVPAAVAILGSLQAQLFEIRGDGDLKRRNIQEMLGWGPFNRLTPSGHWNLHGAGGEDKFIEEVRLAGTLDYTGK